MNSTLTDKICKPTLILDEAKARQNLKTMADKAAVQGIRFRPHFKTHQSAQIGEWFRAAGVEAITVSSLSMAEYFAGHGWEDILVAFLANLREMDTIRRLAGKVRLGLLVESERVVKVLDENLSDKVDIWIKIDTGLHRAGIDHRDVKTVRQLAQVIQHSPQLNLRGLLTHAGQTYHAHSTEEIRKMYAASCSAMQGLREALQADGIGELEISVGDTPGCCLSDDLGGMDEIRPGNFIFFDAMMLELGVCALEDIAVAVACPVVAVHPDQGEVIVYGGAVHLSKEALDHNGQTIYGFTAFPAQDGWRFAGKQNYVKATSQEHGIVKLQPEEMKDIREGDLLYILPVHSCLAVDELGEYLTMQGERIPTMLSCD